MTLPPSVVALREVRLAGPRVPGEDETDPWAMPLVVRLEKAAPPTHDDVLAAAARAVVALLVDDRTAPDGEWHEPVRRWLDRRIRKVVRRARATRWEAVLDLPGATASVGTAEVRALLPHAVADPPPEVSRLQVAGLELESSSDAVPAGPGLQVLTSPHVTITTGKAAAQVGHATQLFLTYGPSETVDRWLASGAPLVVRPASVPEWSAAVAAEGAGSVVVRDGGFTEVEPGTATALADWRMITFT